MHPAPRVMVAGSSVNEEEFVRDLQEKDPAATRKLVEQLKRDQTSAGSDGLALLVKAFGNRLFSYISQHLDGDDALADEVFNDTLGRIHRGIDDYDFRKAAFRTWVYLQARYAVLERKRKLRPSEAVAAVEAQATDWPDEPLSVREQLAMRRAFRGLPDAQRRLLWLRHVEGWLPSEIARLELVQNIPEDHIRVYINRSSRKLARDFTEELRASAEAGQSDTQ
jgi:RNA polymerase sigma factor (sigma-70 family)